jgi:cytochrome c-type biogenesis protein CcmH
MSPFWLLAAVLLLGALSALLWPLLRSRRAAGVPDADAAAIAVFRDQKRSVEADFASGAITRAERDAALADLTQRVVEEVSDSPRSPATSLARSRAWPLAVALLIALPVLAVLLYGRLGDPGAAAVAGAAAGPHELSEAQINAMVGGLAKRLEQHPDDAEGWALLARSYYALGRFPEAVKAYAKATSLGQDNADLLADYADALAMSQDRRLAGAPVALIDRALAIDPRHPKALALAATAAMEAHDADKSIGYWRRLAAELPPDSDEARQVAGVITELGGASRDAANPSAATPTAGGTAGTISGRVELSPALAKKAAPSDAVFIFARTPSGPRMPLAALRIAASELPKNFTLDDTMGMAAGAKLSSASEVVIEARLSRSGNALPQPGDFFGKSAPIKPGATGLHITIDQVVP